MWPDKTDTSYPAEKIRFYKHGKDEFNLSGMPEGRSGLRKEFKLRQRDVNQLGSFPLPGARSEEEAHPLLRAEQVQQPDHGLRREVPRAAALPRQQRLHARRRAVPALRGVGSRCSEVDCHEGDTAMLVTRGQITFFMPETEEVYFVKTGEVMYIPERVKYQLINYDDTPVEAYFAIGGGL